MRRFSSYGPVDTDLHYYAPREGLIDQAYTQLTGEDPKKGGHYITVWAPRQCGKTWVMQRAIRRIKQSEEFTCGIFAIESGKTVKTKESILELFTGRLSEVFGRKFPKITEFKQLPGLFTKKYFKKPVILVIDEFDALQEEFISDFAAVFREMLVNRTNEEDKPSREKTYLLHGLALIGVRRVLGIENKTGSPFNVQRSVHVPNLTYDEVEKMFQWYEKERGQKVESEVVNNLYKETRGQPGLVCWLGELLSDGFEGYTVDKTLPIGPAEFKFVYTAATIVLPNNNILNLISKAKKEANTTFLLEMFKTGEKMEFTFDDPAINDLYMNGLVDKELESDGRFYLRFSCPLVQKRIFNYFSNTYFRHMGQLVAPFTQLDDVITDTHIHIPNLLRLYQTYLETNKDWLFKSAPRRADMRLYEAVYHFNLYAYLDSFLKNQGGRVFPEFPTGNGKIDFVLTYEGNKYGIELKSFSNDRTHKKALQKAAHYGKQLKLREIFLVSFVETIDDETRKKYEIHHLDDAAGVNVIPVFIATGK